MIRELGEKTMTTVTTPEKIYHWLNTQLSIARHYGGCDYNGRHYIIDIDDADQPLVREDVYKREYAQKKLDAKRRRDDNAALQTSFLSDTSNLAAVEAKRKAKKAKK
jgi:hypothetical protein